MVQPDIPSVGLSGALNLMQFRQEKDVTMPENEGVMLPRVVSDWDKSTICMFLEEFQDTCLSQYNFSIAGFMQDAAESPTCPHFVTCSAMSILAREIPRRGSLFGRFDSEPIEPMTECFGAELAAGVGG